MVVVSPCPGSTSMSSGWGSTTRANESSIAAVSPPGRSVRPIDPANSRSPESISGSAPVSMIRNAVEPGV